MSGTRERLEQHVRQLAEVIGERNVHRPEALEAARRYIRETWQQLGYEVSEQEYPVDPLTCANLEISRLGTEHPDQVILVGAHYDTVLGSPGANDNGSGIAVLLELARLFQTCQPERTVRLVAFTNEEAPFFFTGRQGSMVYARQARGRGDDIRLMIALETMGCFRDEPGSQQYPPLFRLFYPNRGNFIALVCNWCSRRRMRRLARAFRRVSDFPLEHVATFSGVPGVAWSDHLSFWRQGYRALMVTDTAFYRYPYYHSPQDTAEKLDYARLGQVTEGLFEAIRLLAREGV
jgi:Zn-dependent M28 family amino/carboxypeptidase